MTDPDLSIIIVSHNARDDLVRCLASLHAAPPAVAHEIIVIDNASTDGSAEAARQHAPEALLLVSERNVGFARANNVAIRRSRGRLLLLLNSDTIVPAGAVDALVASLETCPEAAVAGPRLVDEGGRPELSFGRMLGPWNELRQKLLAGALSRGPLWLSRLIARRTECGQRPDWVSGACLLVRREDAEAVGLLDERYFMYAEDVDFCAAIRTRGRLILFSPGSQIVHVRGRSGRRSPEATRRAYRLSQLRFYEKHHPGWAPVLRAYLRLRRQLP
jgi:N-acetylglucosaminyl-diphospho-decaprenol L-rhamnosyltransferase